MGKLKVKCGNCNSALLRYKTKTNTYFCGFKCKGEWQVKQREAKGYTKDWLIDEYHNKGKTCNQIAKEIGKDPKRVWQWMVDYGLEIRPRGGDSSSGSFQKGTKLWVGRKHKESTKEKIRAARLKDGHVPYLKNGVHWMKGMNSENHPSWKGGLTPERQSVYSSKEWSKAVKKVWKRDNAICQNCGKHHNTEKNRGSFHIHHIVSFQVRELRTDPDNLVLLCKQCHRWVHSKENINKKFIKTINQ